MALESGLTAGECAIVARKSGGPDDFTNYTQRLEAAWARECKPGRYSKSWRGIPRVANAGIKFIDLGFCRNRTVKAPHKRVRAAGHLFAGPALDPPNLPKMTEIARVPPSAAVSTPNRVERYPVRRLSRGGTRRLPASGCAGSCPRRDASDRNSQGQATAEPTQRSLQRPILRARDACQHVVLAPRFIANCRPTRVRHLWPIEFHTGPRKSIRCVERLRPGGKARGTNKMQ